MLPDSGASRLSMSPTAPLLARVVAALACGDGIRATQRSGIDHPTEAIASRPLSVAASVAQRVVVAARQLDEQLASGRSGLAGASN